MRYPDFKQLRMVLSCMAVGLVLSACAPSVQVRSDTAPGVDFSQLNTYNFFSQMGIEGDGYSNLIGQHFRDAIEQQMGARGFSKSETPQLQVNVTASTDDKVRVNTYQDPYLHGGYYGAYRNPYWGMGPGFYGGGTTTTVSQYTQANVYIDVVDAQQHKMVWQGVATFNLTDKMQQEVRQSVVNTVNEIFTQFPVPATASGQ